MPRCVSLADSLALHCGCSSLLLMLPLLVFSDHRANRSAADCLRVTAGLAPANRISCDTLGERTAAEGRERGRTLQCLPAQVSEAKARAGLHARCCVASFSVYLVTIVQFVDILEIFSPLLYVQRGCRRKHKAYRLYVGC